MHRHCLLVQGWFLVGTLEHRNACGRVLNIPRICQLSLTPASSSPLMAILLIMVAGTMFLMWIGDQITRNAHRQRRFPHHFCQALFTPLPGAVTPGPGNPGDRTARRFVPMGRHACSWPLIAFLDCRGGARRDGDAGPAAHSVPSTPNGSWAIKCSTGATQYLASLNTPA